MFEKWLEEVELHDRARPAVERHDISLRRSGDRRDLALVPRCGRSGRRRGGKRPFDFSESVLGTRRASGRDSEQAQANRVRGKSRQTLKYGLRAAKLCSISATASGE